MRVTAIAAALLCAPLFCTTSLCTSAQAQRYVPSGGTVKLTFLCNVNPDCSSSGNSTIRITRPPEHGRISQTHTRDFCYFPPSNPRNVCNNRRVQGVVLRYTAQRGYTGYDSVGAEVFYPGGAMRSGTFNIQVR